MKPHTLFDRRYLLKLAGAAPLLGYIAAQDLAEKAFGAVSKTAKDDVYARIGVRPFINGRGTWTYLSGSLELPEVRAAKQAAAERFVDIFELQHAVSRRLAELSGAQAGMVTSGAAAPWLQRPRHAWQAAIPPRSGNSPTRPASSMKSSCTTGVAPLIAPFASLEENWFWRAE